MKKNNLQFGLEERVIFAYTPGPESWADREPMPEQVLDVTKKNKQREFSETNEASNDIVKEEFNRLLAEQNEVTERGARLEAQDSDLDERFRAEIENPFHAEQRIDAPVPNEIVSETGGGADVNQVSDNPNQKSVDSSVTAQKETGNKKEFKITDAEYNSVYPSGAEHTKVVSVEEEGKEFEKNSVSVG